MSVVDGAGKDENEVIAGALHCLENAKFITSARSFAETKIASFAVRGGI